MPSIPYHLRKLVETDAWKTLDDFEGLIGLATRSVEQPVFDHKPLLPRLARRRSMDIFELLFQWTLLITVMALPFGLQLAGSIWLVTGSNL